MGRSSVRALPSNREGVQQRAASHAEASSEEVPLLELAPVHKADASSRVGVESPTMYATMTQRQAITHLLKTVSPRMHIKDIFDHMKSRASGGEVGAVARGDAQYR